MDIAISGETVEDRLSSTIYVQFDCQLNVVGISTGDNFDALYAEHVKRGDLPGKPRYEYLREYQNPSAAGMGRSLWEGDNE